MVKNKLKYKENIYLKLRERDVRLNSNPKLFKLSIELILLQLVCF